MFGLPASFSPLPVFLLHTLGHWQNWLLKMSSHGPASVASEAAHYFRITAALPSLCSEPLPHGSHRLPWLTRPGWTWSRKLVTAWFSSSSLWICSSVVHWSGFALGGVGQGGGRCEKVLFLFNHHFKPCSVDSLLHPLITWNSGPFTRLC